MQNLDEPIAHYACRFENGNAARALCITAGVLRKLNKNPISEAEI